MRWLLLVLALAGCVQTPKPPPPVPHYVVGAPYQSGGAWFYPREDFSYDATGLAERLPDRAGLTADGEAFDPEAMAGAHHTLQLPSVARVTDLENGRQVLVRLNDRGPARPSRIIGLTRRAAEVLGVPANGAVRVRVQVEDRPSQALRDRLHGGPGGIVAAPREAVTAESLAPPPGVGTSSRGRVAAATPEAAGGVEPDAAAPEGLPEAAQQVAVQRTQLWIDAGRFGQAAYANQVKAKLYGLPVEVQRVPGGRVPSFRVKAGPFATAADADAALDRAWAAGVTDAEIVVE